MPEAEQAAITWARRLGGVSGGVNGVGRLDAGSSGGTSAERRAVGVPRTATAVPVDAVVIPFPDQAARARWRSQGPDGFPPASVGARPRPLLQAMVTHAGSHPEAGRLAA
ncbi:hypothetical protein AB0B45_17310 [Nonomuraea sp. NPDC049152]|uniref:hypothetical protein n=1 Tax=Nonomuraea sp. NPDC049152 TaxID=3154350 RepID=UPI0033F0A2CA